MASTIGRKLAEFAAKLSLPIPLSLGGTGSTTGFTQPNLLINSLFTYNGRAFAGGALTAGGYGYDRWGAYTGNANYSVSNGVITIVSGAVCQPIENPRLQSQTVTVSVDTPSAAVTVTLGTAATNVSGVITAGAGRRSVTLLVPAGLTGDLQVRFSGAASFKEPKLEIGTVATPYQSPVVADEDARIKRYYQNWDSVFGLSANAAVANGNAKPITQMYGTPVVLQTTAGSGASWAASATGRAVVQNGVHSADAGTTLLRLSAELVCTN